MLRENIISSCVNIKITIFPLFRCDHPGCDFKTRHKVSFKYQIFSSFSLL